WSAKSQGKSQSRFLETEHHAAPGLRPPPDEPLVMGAVYTQQGEVSTPLLLQARQYLSIARATQAGFRSSTDLPARTLAILTRIFQEPIHFDVIATERFTRPGSGWVGIVTSPCGTRPAGAGSRPGRERLPFRRDGRVRRG